MTTTITPEALKRKIRHLRIRADSGYAQHGEAWAQGVRFAANQIEDALPELLAAQPASSSGGQEPIGTLTISHFRGSASMENTDFDYTGNLAPGSYAVYAAPVAGEAAQDCGYCCPNCGRDYQSNKQAAPAPAAVLAGVLEVVAKYIGKTSSIYRYIAEELSAHPQPAPQGVDLGQLLRLWEERSRGALPADAMLINKHLRELREALSASQQHQQKESGDAQ